MTLLKIAFSVGIVVVFFLCILGLSLIVRIVDLEFGEDRSR